MKAIIRTIIPLLTLLIVVSLLFVLPFVVSAAEPDEVPPAEEIAADEENGLSRVEALWIALMPSVGATIAAATVAYKIIKQFKELRTDVIADGQIAAIKRETKKLQNNIEQLIRFQENDIRDTEGLKKSLKRMEQTAQRMEQTAQKLEMHMCRIETSMNEPEKGVMGHL